MSSKITKIPTAGMSREKWLELRKHNIGGSDASAIVGLNDYATPFTVWADKTGRLPEKPDTEAMRQGRDLEGYVAKRWCEAKEKKVRRLNAMLYNPDYPFASANIDRMVVGENAGLECKTTSFMNLKKLKNGEYPENYYVQCVHYMAVTGADRWYLGVLVHGQGFYDFVIERDEDEIAVLMKQEAEFWEYVQSNTSPPLDGEVPTTDALNTIYSVSSESVIELFGVEGMMQEYFRLQEEIDTKKKAAEEIKQSLMKEIGENETALCGQYKIDWKTQIRNIFDKAAFTADNPDVDISPYYKQSYSRPFKIKELA